MNQHPDLFRLHDAKGNNHEFVLAGERDGGIPGVQNCPGCERTWADLSESVPSFDVDAHPDRLALRTSGPCSLAEVHRLLAAVRPHAPTWATLRPGTRLGRWHGTVQRKPQDLMLSRGSGLVPTVLLSPLLQELVETHGIRLPTRVSVDLEHDTRGKPRDLRGYAELEIPPGIKLHALSFADVAGRGPGCDTCGWPAKSVAVQQFIVAPGASMPTGMSLCRVGNARHEILVTRACRTAMVSCGVPPTHFWPIYEAPRA